ncbi:ankyrin repeat and SOCS box protein 2-like isoform X3 [Lethenteron reissneri]|uniref:ankyrin repeat and SOCS box protein 2-like isoform X3 n=1 Tax=Lethenteron reissneri TaxID=7753 RepID=UPI002AB7DB41|nr:ankyrin repeat and SOCS box protein 2-like isoform X3 [Lethenteron reissneri]
MTGTRSEDRRRRAADPTSSSASCGLSADAALRNANRATRGPFVWQRAREPSPRAPSSREPSSREPSPREPSPRAPSPRVHSDAAEPLTPPRCSAAAERTASRRPGAPLLRNDEDRSHRALPREVATPRQTNHVSVPRGALPPPGGHGEAVQTAAPPRTSSKAIQGCSHKPPPEDSCEDASLGLSLHKQVKLQQQWSPVSMAINDDNAFELTLLREAGVNLLRVPGQLLPAIHEAAMLGKTRCLRMLTQAFPKALDERTKTNDTALHLATCQGKTECVDILLQAGANPNVHNTWMETPLYKACEYLLLEVAELLVRHGANVNTRDLHSHTPIYEAITRHSLPIVQLLVAAGARVDVRDNYGATPLFVAAQCGVLSVVAYLVRMGSDVERATQDGSTPLFEACRNGHEEVAAFLVASGAKVNRLNDGELLPLHAAAQQGSLRLTSLLAESTSRIAVARSGISPLHLAAKHNHDDVLGTLLDLGFDPNALLSHSRSKYFEDRRTTALFFAVSNNNLNAARRLLRAGADPNLDVLQPLLVAVRMNSLPLVEALLEHGADTEKPVVTIGRPTAFPSVLVYCASDVRMLGLLLREGCDARSCFDCAFGVDSHHVQFCELLTSKAMSPHCESIVCMLLEHVANVHLCSCILQLLWENCEDVVTIQRLAETPRSLVHLCRLKIRSTLGRKRLRSIQCLPLPPVLKNYLGHVEDSRA